MQRLQGCDATRLDAGEAIIIQTPTAGGYGDPGKRQAE
jgi:5-oxoprolinase (ATP-hydrolysing)